MGISIMNDIMHEKAAEERYKHVTRTALLNAAAGKIELTRALDDQTKAQTIPSQYIFA